MVEIVTDSEALPILEKLLATLLAAGKNIKKMIFTTAAFKSS